MNKQNINRHSITIHYYSEYNIIITETNFSLIILMCLDALYILGWWSRPSHWDDLFGGPWLASKRLKT